MKKKNLVELVKMVAVAVFVITCFLTIRWSDFPVIKCALFDNPIFVHNESVDSAYLNIVTGYVSGYIVYFLTVVVPTKTKTGIVMREVNVRLIAIYNEFIFTLLLMGKSASTEKEWKCILNRETDLECFDSTYKRVMRKFDITAEAETAFKKQDENKTYVTISWIEYLEMKMKSWYAELDDITLRYQIYMTDELIECIYGIKASDFFDMVLGRGISMQGYWEGDDGIGYFENIPLSKFLGQEKNESAPVFSINHGIDPWKQLEICIEKFSDLYKIIHKKIKNKSSAPNCSLEKFKKHSNVGHFVTARIEPNDGIKQ